MEYYALLWEMRVGKTLPIIDTIVHNHKIGKIDSALVIAPSGVHINWSRQALKEHRPSDSVIEWASGNANKVSFKKLLDNCMKDRTNLLWICMNVEALITDAGKSIVQRLIKDRKPFLVIDESDELKNPRAKRSKFMMLHASKFPMRRIMTGTDAPLGPFDLWSQFYILSPSILGPRFVPFKQRYGIFKTVRYGGPSFQELVSYKDLDHLSARIKPFSSRLTQKDTGIDIPMDPQVRYFIMSDKQQKAYDQMLDDMMVELDNGNIVTAQMALVWLLRLQQISRGFLPDGQGGTVEIGSSPSTDSLLGLLKQISGKTIIWCRFKNDVDAVCKSLGEAGRKFVRHDGQLSKEERQASLEIFRNDQSVTEFVGTPATGGIGIDLSVAGAMVFYSHSYDFRERVQAIARMQGINQKMKNLLLVDMLAYGSKDVEIISNLARKAQMMDQINGDTLRQLENGVVGMETKDLLSMLRSK